MTRTTRHAATYCPSCHKCLDASTHPKGNAKPKPGDVSVCMYCTAPLQFTAGLALVPLDLSTVDAETAAKLRWAIALAKRMQAH
jgi:hypothetical protein